MAESATAGGVDRHHEELTIINAFRRILRLLRLTAVGIQAEVGISAAQLYVLRQLAADKDGASIGELAQQTLTDRSSVASVVDRLVASGFADRSVSEEDRRRAEVRITPAGLELVSQSAPPPTSRLVAALETFPDEELVTLARGLDALVHAMGLDATAAPMLFEDGGEPKRPLQSGRPARRSRPKRR